MAGLNPIILRGLGFTPLILERILSQLPESALDTRPDPERFTVREAVCHLADWDLVIIERIDGALTEDGHPMKAYDPGEIAAERNYSGQDVQLALERFKERRTAYVDLVKNLDGVQLMRTAVHPRIGPMTIQEMVGTFLSHDIYHLEQVSAPLAAD